MKFKTALILSSILIVIILLPFVLIIINVYTNSKPEEIFIFFIPSILSICILPAILMLIKEEYSRKIPTGSEFKLEDDRK